MSTVIRIVNIVVLANYLFIVYNSVIHDGSNFRIKSESIIKDKILRNVEVILNNVVFLAFIL